MKTKTRKFIEKLGKERHYFDWWSLGHVVFGVVVGIILKLTGLIFSTAMFASLFIFSLWEILEPRIFENIIKKPFPESLRNQLMDLVYGFIGFLAYWYVF